MGVEEVSASSVFLAILHCLLPHQIPEQHAEHRVWGQTQEDRPHSFIQTQWALCSAHFQHTI